MDVEEIRSLIAAGLPAAHVEVDGDGRHFSAVVVSDLFAGKTMVQQHQLVYQALGGRVGGEIHALSIRTYTPAEWDAQTDQRMV